MYSLMFVFTWLIVKKLETNQRSFEKFIKPLIISFVYKSCLTYGAAISNGPLNPTLAFELWVWDLGAYNSHLTNAENSKSYFT